MFAVILNYEIPAVECLDLVNKPQDMDDAEYIETILDYSLSNCDWMILEEKPTLNFLN
jgi:hypothetical protein